MTIDEAKNILEKQLSELLSNPLVTLDEAYVKAERMAIEALNSAEKSKRGKWIDGKCNKCGREALHWEMKSWPYFSAYCPYCGADMRNWCKDCKYFENEICKRWTKEYKTKEDGSCFIFEPKMQEVEE